MPGVGDTDLLRRVEDLERLVGVLWQRVDERLGGLPDKEERIVEICDCTQCQAERRR
jgi:hypothetical protein